MSLIFKALQRAESDHSDNARASSATASELIKRAEHQSYLRRAVDDNDHAQRLSGALQESEKRSARVDSHGIDSLPEAASLGEISPFEAKTVHLPFPYQDQLVALNDVECPAAEAFRLLVVRLRHLRRDRPVKRLLISSTSMQEGKSTISANLACTIASASRERVLLIEGDIRRPSLSNIFQIPPQPGLCEYLRGEQTIEESLYRLEEAGIWLMPAGTSTSSQTDLIQSGSLPMMAQQLSLDFDWIIIDSPPVLPLADASVWARLADSILLVARNGATNKRKLKRGIEALDVNKVIGTVVNSSKSSAQEDYYYYNHSSSESRDTVGGD